MNVDRGPAYIVEKEILRSAAGLDDIMSLVIDATYVLETEVDGDGTGRYIVEAGTVLAKIESSNKLQPVYEDDDVSEGNVVGILGHTKEFFISSDVPATSAANSSVPVLHHGCNFDTSKLIGYVGNESAVAGALPTCLFT